MHAHPPSLTYTHTHTLSLSLSILAYLHQSLSHSPFPFLPDFPNSHTFIIAFLSLNLHSSSLFLSLSNFTPFHIHPLSHSHTPSLPHCYLLLFIPPCNPSFSHSHSPSFHPCLSPWISLTPLFLFFLTLLTHLCTHSLTHTLALFLIALSFSYFTPSLIQSLSHSQVHSLLSFSFFLSLSHSLWDFQLNLDLQRTPLSLSLTIYIYIYMCVCVCVCSRVSWKAYTIILYLLLMTFLDQRDPSIAWKKYLEQCWKINLIWSHSMRISRAVHS